MAVVTCSGAAYWTGGTGGPGYIYTIGRFNGALKKFSLAGNTLTLAGVAATVGNFTKLGGAVLLDMRYRLCSEMLLSRCASLHEQLTSSLSSLGRSSSKLLLTMHTCFERGIVRLGSV